MSSRAEESLRAEMASLGVEEILALCYHGIRDEPERLRLYMDVLRSRGGGRAQFASALICFDLARQGDEACQREFIVLADSMRELASQGSLVSTLVGDDPYLSFIWELCQEQLTELDPRIGIGVDPAATARQSVADVAVVDLLSDDDFADFEIFEVAVDDAALRQQFRDAVDLFLGKVPGVPTYEAESGFRMRHRSDTERIEAFLQQLDSLKDAVPEARGFRAVTLLFYGTRMRSKGLFGGLNRHKNELLLAGIEEFLHSGSEVADIAGVFGELHATGSAWPKIADVLLDYLRWVSRLPAGSTPDLSAYPAVERLVARDAARRKLR